MAHKHQKYRGTSSGSDSDLLDTYIDKVVSGQKKKPKRESNSGRLRSVAVVIVMVFGVLYVSSTISNSSLNPFSPVAAVFSAANEPSEDLLNRMNARMVEMGYTGLSHDDLRELRRNGVTATYISNVRALGFNDLTLEQAVSLARVDASSIFLAMMIELGYGDLEIDDFVDLRDAGVTAHYTSNIHDYGYRDVSKDQLIRLQRIGVNGALIERLQNEQGEDITMEDIIRYRISNQ